MTARSGRDFREFIRAYSTCIFYRQLRQLRKLIRVIGGKTPCLRAEERWSDRRWTVVKDTWMRIAQFHRALTIALDLRRRYFCFRYREGRACSLGRTRNRRDP